MIQGDPTDNAKAFHGWLLKAPSNALAGCNFAVFGLGNTQVSIVIVNRCDINSKQMQYQSKISASGRVRKCRDPPPLDFVKIVV